MFINRTLRAALLALIVSLATAGAALAAGTNGWITAVKKGKSFTLRDLTGHLHTYAVNGATTYAYGDGGTATSGVLKLKASVTVSASGSTATRVVVALAQVPGLVTRNAHGTITVVDTEGLVRKVKLRPGTVCQKGTAKLSCSKVGPGSIVNARGRVDRDGTSVDANHIQVYSS